MFHLVIKILLWLNWPELSLCLLMMDCGTSELIKEKLMSSEWIKIFWHNSLPLFYSAKVYLRGSPCWTDQTALSILRLKHSSNHQILWDLLEACNTNLSMKFKKASFSEDWIIKNACFSHNQHLVALYLQQNKLVFFNYLKNEYEGQILHIYEPADGKILTDFAWSPTDNYFSCF